MLFVDRVRIHIKGGRGGNGCVSFRRERYVPLGGPNGGDGGHGGAVIFQADPNLNTLVDFRYKQHFVGCRGDHGRGKGQDGRDGSDTRLLVPTGTVVQDGETQQELTELQEPGQTFVVARGGRGGRGNRFFRTSRRQVPRFATKGREGEDVSVVLTMRLIADVGLIGAPNAGKSTFLRAVTGSQTKIGAHAFTTMYPSLGVLTAGAAAMDHLRRQLVLADLPGLIPGASQGRGLGIRFLQHVERCRLLTVMIAADDEGSVGDRYRQICSELRSFSWDLANKPRWVVLSKSDAVSAQKTDRMRAQLTEESGGPVWVMSAHSGEGLTQLTDALWCHFHDEERKTVVQTPSDEVTWHP